MATATIDFEAERSAIKRALQNAERELARATLRWRNGEIPETDVEFSRERRNRLKAQLEELDGAAALAAEDRQANINAERERQRDAARARHDELLASHPARSKRIDKLLDSAAREIAALKEERTEALTLRTRWVEERGEKQEQDAYGAIHRELGFRPIQDWLTDKAVLIGMIERQRDAFRPADQSLEQKIRSGNQQAIKGSHRQFGER